jgi:hypothetical protein
VPVLRSTHGTPLTKAALASPGVGLRLRLLQEEGPGSERARSPLHPLAWMNGVQTPATPSGLARRLQEVDDEVE